MKRQELIYIELTPDEGKILTNGEIYTTYVCALESLIGEWSEINIEDVEESNLPDENKEF